MTKSVHTIGPDRSLADAHRLMGEHRIRHLPVLHGGELVGLVSERDLHLIETLKGVTRESVPVEDAMSQAPWTAAPELPLQQAAEHMFRHKVGSAVVMRGQKVVGVLTTSDALRALAELLAVEPGAVPALVKQKPGKPSSTPAPRARAGAARGGAR